ncbi:MAG: O-antigen ligase family protein [Thainema sp.]
MSASSTAETASVPKSGRLFALLTGAFFVLFTLLPNSNSLMVAWPWVFLWQVGLLCPILWLIAQVWQTRSWPKVGHGIDWLLGFITLSLILSSVLAEFPAQARWYGWATLGFVAALIVLTDRLRTSEQRYSLLVKQGYLSLAFILVSLGLWITQTLLPELARLRELRQLGYEAGFDFSTLTLRNWVPLGHQNYVAGFLLLVLPLVVGLAILDKSKRNLWLVTLGLGLVDLYTTSSRGGWLGLVVICVFGFVVLLWRSSISRSRLLLAGAGGLAVLVVLVAANNRLRTLIPALLQGDTGGELAYRVVTTVTGWHMGVDNWFAGAGLGSVPLLYQRYRPDWAGHLGELAYQLHSTPVQIWAELGLLGVLIMLAAAAIFVYLLVRWLTPAAKDRPMSDQVLALCLLSGLLSYGALSLTDYQLDNVAISGMIVIYVAVLAAATPRPGHTSAQTVNPTEMAPVRVLPTKQPLPVLGAISLSLVTLIMVISLVPAHRAWQLSSQAFLAIDRVQPNWQAFNQFLSRAHEIAPWEPYYPYQLGWNFGNIPRTAEVEAEQAQELIEQGIAGLQTGTEVAPYSEFGYSNLGWLLRDSGNAEAAAQAFAASAELVPAKRGVFFGLGLNLADQDQAIEAMALEILRDPLFVTSPVWLEPGLRSQFPLILDRVETRLDELITTSETNADQSELAAYWHQIRGGINWWQEDWDAAHADWDNYGDPSSQAVLALSEDEQVAVADVEALPDSAAKYAMLAWLSPEQRQEYLDLAWLYATETPPIGELQTALLTGMAQSDDFDQWLRQNAITRRYRNERLGFGTLSRHIDGPIPEDFWVIVENIPTAQFFSDLLPTPVYNKPLDQSLQPWRDQLLSQV